MFPKKIVISVSMIRLLGLEPPTFDGTTPTPWSVRLMPFKTNAAANAGLLTISPYEVNTPERREAARRAIMMPEPKVGETG